MNITLQIFIFIFMLAACRPKKYMTPTVKISKNDSLIVRKLYSYYNEWKGVKYRIGGLSKKGVDCSGYVHLAYQQKLNKKIPRSTELMAKSGKAIKLKNVRPGDLVFFKTGLEARHVGIYIGKGEFMHAASSRGVMISKLDNSYWIDAYWMIRRY